MNYEFNQPLDRTQTISIKWSPQLRRQMYGEDDIIPMGIADMDFKVSPAIARAVKDRAPTKATAMVTPRMPTSRPAWTGSAGATTGRSGPIGLSTPPGSTWPWCAPLSFTPNPGTT